MEGISKEAVLVKLSDRFNNVSCVHLVKKTKPKKYKRYIKETTEIFLPVAKKYSNYFYQKILQVLEKNKKIN